MEISKKYGAQTFGNLRSQKLLGEKILQSIYNEIGPFKSASKLSARITALDRKGAFKENPMFGFNLRYIVNEMMEAIYINDDFLYKQSGVKVFDDVDSYCKELKGNIIKKKNKANCWEQMVLVFNELQKSGEIPHPFKMGLYFNETWQADHFTVVFGLKKAADITNPKTWGQKAVIVDSWLGFADSAKNGIEKITNFISGKKITKINYSEALFDYVHFKNPIKNKE